MEINSCNGIIKALNKYGHLMELKKKTKGVIAYLTLQHKPSTVNSSTID